jgi:hypothetical protein
VTGGTGTRSARISACAARPQPICLAADLGARAAPPRVRVVDTAHRLVELFLDIGDVTGARWAVDQAWLADPDRASDIAWRDLLRVAAAEGNTAELEQLLGDLMRGARRRAARGPRPRDGPAAV